MKHLIVVAGATASGKTSLGIQLAQHFNTVIISADSRQFYKEMTIGTAKPTEEELSQAQHYFVNSLSIEEDYSVGQFERDVVLLLEQLFQRHDIVIMVGGSGLYIKAVCEGLDKFPNVPEQVRQELIEIFQKEGIEPLQEELKKRDPDYYAEVDLHNQSRLIRALEVCRSSGQPYSSFRKAKKAERPFTSHMIAFDWERETLYDRINQRVDLMLEEGLEEEARQLHSKKSLNALQTVGYQEWFDFFEEKYDREEAVRLVKRNTRRYAKRQMTWLRRDDRVHYFKPNERDVIVGFLENIISKSTEIE